MRLGLDVRLGIIVYGKDNRCGESYSMPHQAFRFNELWKSEGNRDIMRRVPETPERIEDTYCTYSIPRTAAWASDR